MIDKLHEDDIQKLLDTFTCSRDNDVDIFIRQKAIRFERSDNARTYLIVDSLLGDILAYFSLSFKEILLEEFSVSKSQIKKLDGISKSATKIRAFLIGQLAKNDNVEQNFLKLQDILNEVYQVVYHVQSFIGGRTIILECKNIPSLITTYEQHCFSILKTELTNDGLITMYTCISS